LASSRSTKKRRPNPARQVNGGEPFRRVEIVLAAFVDDPQITFSRGVFIGKDSIDLV